MKSNKYYCTLYTCKCHDETCCCDGKRFALYNNDSLFCMLNEITNGLHVIDIVRLLNKDFKKLPKEILTHEIKSSDFNEFSFSKKLIKNFNKLKYYYIIDELTIDYAEYIITTVKHTNSKFKSVNGYSVKDIKKAIKLHYKGKL